MNIFIYYTHIYREVLLTTKQTNKYKLIPWCLKFKWGLIFSIESVATVPSKEVSFTV